ncbi:MAG: AbrB family transcriptional regulator [Chthoniobacter sp.]
MAAVRFEPFRGLPKAAQWSILVAISVLITALLRRAQLPAALLLGPMIAAILVEYGGGRIRVPKLPFSFAQPVIGCMIARVLTADIFLRFFRQWPLFLGVVVAVIVASCLLGLLISKLRILPETTAIWGLLPGAASVMMLMAEAFGADMRLVAFMQYLRVIFVAGAASVIARFWVHASGGAPATVWFPAIHWVAFGETLALIVVGMVVGRRLRIPAGGLLVPMVLGAGLHLGHVIELELPPWLLASGYLLLGWTTGLRFTREILAHAGRTLPQIVGSIALLMAFCGLLSWLLVRVAGIDALTAYLATSPGGADSVAIIAASSKVDVPFVMALQTVRFLAVLMIGPPLSRWAAGMLKPGVEDGPGVEP